MNHDVARREFLMHAVGAAAVVSLLPSSLPAAPVRRGAPLGVGVVGCGRQGSAILLELAKLDAVKVLAVCDTEPSRVDRAVRRTQGAQGYASHPEMLDKAKDVQAVIIATPTHEHKAPAIDALAAGRHVYCETPLAHTPEDCAAIAKAGQGSRLVAAAALEGRSNPIYQLSRTFFKSDSVRDLAYLRAQACQKTTWRAAADSPEREKRLNWRLDPAVSLGLPGELGVQQYDVFHWFRGAYPVRVRGAGSIRLHADGRAIHDTTHCAFSYADGVMQTWDATLANSFQGRHEVLCGSNAAIKLAWTAGWMFKEADAPTQGWEVYANKQQFHNDEGITLIADATKLASQGKLKEGVGLPNPPLYYALADFVRSITEQKPVAASLGEGARATLVAIAASQAAARGVEVSIDPASLSAL